MKLKLVLVGFVCCLFMQVAAQSQSVNHVAEEMVEITTSSATVHEWFKLIEEQGVVLAYNPQLIDLDKVQHITQKQMTVQQILEKILNDYKFRTIPVETDKLIIQIDGKRELVVSGVIREKTTGERLYGAIVMFRKEAQKPTFVLTDSRGWFTLNLLPGDYNIEVQYMGYASFQQEMKIRSERVLKIELSPVSIELEEVTIKPRNGTTELNEATPSNMLSFNSYDLFSQINILPGVIGSMAGGNLQVNGGGGDENLMLLDGVPIYHPSHINSMLSPFNGDAIKNVTFHKSFFPTEYEGRLSSITDIKLKEGNKQKYSQTLTLDMPAASVLLEGPIIKNKLSYMLGGRRSWLDFFDGLLSEEYRLNHSFYDFNAKLSYDIDERSSIQIMAYKTNDNYFYPEEKEKLRSVLNWDNDLYAVTFNTVWAKKLINTNTLAYSSYSNKVYAPLLGFNLEKDIRGGVKEFSFSSNFSYDIHQMYTLSGGMRASRERFDMAVFGDTITTLKEPITQLSFFYDMKVRVTDKLYSQFGVNLVGYLPQNSRYYYSIQPRFSLKYVVSKNNLLYVGISKMQQFYHYLRLGLMPMPTDFRMPSIMGFKPSISGHYEIGWKHFLEHGYMEGSVYYKQRRNIMALRPEIYPTDNAWEKYIMSGKGESYGIKFFSYNDWRKFTLQFAYSYARSKEWYNDLKDKGKVSSLHDIPHSFNLGMTYKFTPFSGISIGTFLQSGKIKSVNEEDELLPIEQFRSQRENVNYRLDASYNYTKVFKGRDARLMFRIGLYNIIGNPSEEDAISMYSINFDNHCLPYGSISFKF